MATNRNKRGIQALTDCGTYHGVGRFQYMETIGHVDSIEPYINRSTAYSLSRG